MPATHGFFPTVRLPGRRVKVTQKIFLMQQLHVMTKAGVPLTSTLRTLQTQATGKHLRGILGDLVARVEKGQALAEAMRPYETDFGDLMINMIAAGEASGRLEEVFGQIYLQMKKDHEIVSKVRGALMYPAIVVFAMAVIGTGVIVFIIPRLTEIFRESNVELPLPTRILVGLSDFIVNNGLLVGGSIILLGSCFVWAIHRPGGRYVWHWLLLRLPVAGRIIRQVNLARFARTVSAFLKTDIPIVKTLTTTAHVLGNVHYQRALVAASERITKGVTLEEVLRQYPHLFNPTILQMINVGEQSGALDDILADAADFYEAEVTQTMATLPSLLEPVLMIILGVGVGGMAVAIMLPLYSLTQAF